MPSKDSRIIRDNKKNIEKPYGANAYQNTPKRMQ